jgi:hypothetical protein
MQCVKDQRCFGGLRDLASRFVETKNARATHGADPEVAVASICKAGDLCFAEFVWIDIGDCVVV